MVYTPGEVVDDILDWVHPWGVCLDPCRGDGAFYDKLPPGRQWCELAEGRDFFGYSRRVDWVIGNPPYSIFHEFLLHSFMIAPNVVFIVPTNKVFQRLAVMDDIQKWGGVKAMRIYGSGTNVGFPFGFSVGAFHFRKDWRGPTDLTFQTQRLVAP